MELEGSLPCSQNSVTDSYPVFEESSLHRHILYIYDPL